MSSRRSKNTSQRKRSSRSIGNMMTLNNKRIWALLEILIYTSLLVWVWIQLGDFAESTTTSGLDVFETSRGHNSVFTTVTADNIRNILVVIYVLTVLKVLLKGFGGDNAMMKMMESGQNWVRWLDNLITLPSIVMLVALFCGVNTYYTLLAIVALSVIYTMVGTLMEYIGSTRQDNSRGLSMKSMALIPPLIQVIVLLTIWSVIFMAWNSLATPPDYINYIFYVAAIAHVVSYAATFSWYYSYSKAPLVSWTHEFVLWAWKIIIPVILVDGLKKNLTFPTA